MILTETVAIVQVAHRFVEAMRELRTHVHMDGHAACFKEMTNAGDKCWMCDPLIPVAEAFADERCSHRRFPKRHDHEKCRTALLKKVMGDD